MNTWVSNNTGSAGKTAPPTTIRLTKNEVQDLYDFCSDNLAVGTIEIEQSYKKTTVMVTDLPETLTDITDTDSW